MKVPDSVKHAEFQRMALRQEIDSLERRQRREKDPRRFELRRAHINASRRDLRALGG